MTKPRNRLQACTGFQWDDGNATKNWDKHGVSQAECEQVFFNQPLIVRRDRRHSEVESRYYALGRIDADRLLFVCFAVCDDLIRVISARDMSPSETRRSES